MFTREHYEAIAKVMKAQLEHVTEFAPETTGAEAMVNAIHALVVLFQENPKFLAVGFRSACGLVVKEEAR